MIEWDVGQFRLRHLDGDRSVAELHLHYVCGVQTL
jgi:hypothetical protein